MGLLQLCRAVGRRRRGDAKPDSVANIFDALFIAQWLVGLRDFGPASTDCHPINAASARRGGAGGGKGTILDAPFVAQSFVGLRHDRFE